jgi:glycosyltransferase involved in cell wall biosynthesis
VSKGLFSLVVPVYREEKGIAPFLKRTLPVLKSLGMDYELIFCMDPSPDGTEAAIRAAAAKDKRVKLLLFSRRFGQPAATLAGLAAAKGGAVAVIDVDLQDPPELLPRMLQRWRAGVDVVVARRSSRKGETAVKKLVSSLGYWLINSASEVPIPREAGDFRLMSRRVVDRVVALKEKHGFLRGLVALVGFRQETVVFERSERAEGEGKYNRYLGSLKIGFNGLVGFSNFLLNATLLAGLAIAALSVGGVLFMVVARLVYDVQYPLGIPTTIVLTLFLGGVQLVCIGILGQYIGRIYDEVKDRPLTIIDKTLNMGAPRRGNKKRG